MKNIKNLYLLKKGKATSRNKNENQYFAIYDNQGYGWTIH